MAKGMPWQKWDLDDWCDDAELKLCCLTSQGLLPRLMQVMARADRYGYLRISGAEPELNELSAVLGANHQTVRKCLTELEERRVLKRDRHGLFSERMLLDRDKWLKSHADGSKGGNPALMGERVNPPLNPPVNPPLKVEIEEELRTKNKEKELRVSSPKRISDDTQSVFNHWLTKENLIHHRELTEAQAGHINAKLKNFSVDEIRESIDNYSEILDDDDYMMNYRWPIGDFMLRGCEKFMSENDPFESYPKWKQEREEGADVGQKIREAEERVRRRNLGEGDSPADPPF